MFTRALYLFAANHDRSQPGPAPPTHTDQPARVSSPRGDKTARSRPQSAVSLVRGQVEVVVASSKCLWPPQAGVEAKPKKHQGNSNTSAQLKMRAFPTQNHASPNVVLYKQLLNVPTRRSTPSKHQTKGKEKDTGHFFIAVGRKNGRHKPKARIFSGGTAI